MADELNGKKGEWKTINGARVFIENGKSVKEALSELSNKPQKYYRAKRGGMRFVIPESELEKHRAWGDDIQEEIDLSNSLDFINNMNLDESILQLKRKLMIETANLEKDVRRFLLTELNNKIAEHQESLAKEFLSNIPKHKDISTEESLVSINQDKFNWSKTQDPHSPEYAGFTHNCQRCAQAFILRWCHGYDVQAKLCEKKWNDKLNKFEKAGTDVKLNEYALKNGYDRMIGDIYSNYNGWDRVIFNEQDVKKTLVDGNYIASEIGYSGTEDQLRWIKKTVKESGPGSAYLCSVCWKGTRTDDGTYDAHVFCIVNDGGKVKFYDPQTGTECSSYFTDKQIVPKKTEIFRADNCRLNGTMMKEVVDYEKTI